MQRRAINPFLRKIALAVFVVAVVLLICAFGYGLVWLFNQLNPLITAASSPQQSSLGTWALRNSTNRLWEAGQRQFDLEGPFLHPVIQSHSAIAEGLKFFSIFNHPTVVPGLTRSVRKPGFYDQEMSGEVPRCSNLLRPRWTTGPRWY